MIGLITFACIFGCALFGMGLSLMLPKHHMDKESQDAVKLGAGLIATMAALVLGLLVSSAKSSFDTMNDGIIEMGAKVIMLDRVLASRRTWWRRGGCQNLGQKVVPTNTSRLNTPVRSCCFRTPTMPCRMKSNGRSC